MDKPSAFSASSSQISVKLRSLKSKPDLLRPPTFLICNHVQHLLEDDDV